MARTHFYHISKITYRRNGEVRVYADGIDIAIGDIEHVKEITFDVHGISTLTHGAGSVGEVILTYVFQFVCTITVYPSEAQNVSIVITDK